MLVTTNVAPLKGEPVGSTILPITKPLFPVISLAAISVGVIVTKEALEMFSCNVIGPT